MNLKIEALELKNTSLEKENASLKQTVQSLMFILCESNASYYMMDKDSGTDKGNGTALNSAKRNEYCKHQIMARGRQPLGKSRLPITTVFIGRIPLDIKDPYFVLTKIEGEYNVKFNHSSRMYRGASWQYCFANLHTKSMATKLMARSPLVINTGVPGPNSQLCLTVNRAFDRNSL